MEPITLGIAAIAALLLQACGGDETINRGKNNDDDGGADADGMAGSGGAAGTGGSTSAGGSGGRAGAGGAAGSGGAGGAAGYDGGSDSAGAAGMDGSSYVDASDASNPVSVPYHFGLLYGSSVKEGVRGTGMLYFSDLNSCQLLGGSFDAEFESGGNVALSVDLTGSPSINLCGSAVTLPLAGGLFDGVSLLLTNHSEILTSKQSYEITSCSSSAPSDGGGAVEDCSGALEKTNP